MKTAHAYWQKVQDISARVIADADDPDDLREWADDYVENDGCLDVPVADLERLVSYSKHPDAFNEWEQGDVKTGSLRWWWVRAFYAMTNDVYSYIDKHTYAQGVSE